MTIDHSFNAISPRDGWAEKVVKADDLWAQVQALLAKAQAQLAQTPRRPDLRLIVDNISGAEICFLNPGNHSNSKPEVIPAAGDKTAVMVMVRGATLAEQRRNAETLFSRFDLGAKGLSAEFVAALGDGSLRDLVDEAYGPAPFAAQAEKLAALDWQKDGGEHDCIAPVQGRAAAYGARAAVAETVFHAAFNIYVQGTGTTPELVESHGMCIAVTSDWQTGAVSTRPIVPSVARTYYGAYFDRIPTVQVTPEGLVRALDLKNGAALTVPPPKPGKPRKPG